MDKSNAINRCNRKISSIQYYIKIMVNEDSGRIEEGIGARTRPSDRDVEDHDQRTATSIGELPNAPNQLITVCAKCWLQEFLCAKEVDARNQ